MSPPWMRPVKERSKSAYQAFSLNLPRWHVDGSAPGRGSRLRKEVKVRTRLFSLIFVSLRTTPEKARFFCNLLLSDMATIRPGGSPLSQQNAPNGIPGPWPVSDTYPVRDHLGPLTGAPDAGLFRALISNTSNYLQVAGIRPNACKYVQDGLIAGEDTGGYLRKPLETRPQDFIGCRDALSSIARWKGSVLTGGIAAIMPHRPPAFVVQRITTPVVEIPEPIHPLQGVTRSAFNDLHSQMLVEIRGNA